MADVRSLLRNERAARRINHPQAQYSPNGVLSCKACRTQLKSDALWQPHLTSPQHINTLKRLAAGLKSQSTVSAGTKRKAEDDGSQHEEGLALRKRARPDTEDEQQAQREAEEPSQGPSPPAEPAPDVQDAANTSSKQNPKDNIMVDEDEWAAFERDVATPPPEDESKKPSIFKAEATISAAPMTAAELASKSQQEAGIQTKEQREAELAAEKEDAQRRLEEEFDQMEELEERVRRLKEKREALRLQALERRVSGGAKDEQQDVPIAGAEESEDDESDYDDDWDNWGRP